MKNKKSKIQKIHDILADLRSYRSEYRDQDLQILNSEILRLEIQVNRLYQTSKKYNANSFILR